MHARPGQTEKGELDCTAEITLSCKRAHTISPQHARLRQSLPRDAASLARSKAASFLVVAAAATFPVGGHMAPRADQEHLTQLPDLTLHLPETPLSARTSS